MSKILERGDIFFFYRLRVDATEAQELEDVQRFWLVLKPEGRRLYRRIIVGRKRHAGSRRARARVGLRRRGRGPADRGQG